ncbi:MAG: hypothetical protein ACKV1O_07180 [Saprospiraceae bacterium]
MATDALFQKAFNAGYLIEKYLPKLSKMLVKGMQDKTSPFAEGFTAGSSEMELERLRSNSKLLQKLREGARNPDQGKIKNRDDKGMDMDIER